MKKKKKYIYNEKLAAATIEVQDVLIKYSKEANEALGNDKGVEIVIQTLSYAFGTFLTSMSNAYPDVTKEQLLGDCFANIESIYDQSKNDEISGGNGTLH